MEVEYEYLLNFVEKPKVDTPDVILTKALAQTGDSFIPVVVALLFAAALAFAIFLLLKKRTSDISFKEVLSKFLNTNINKFICFGVFAVLVTGACYFASNTTKAYADEGGPWRYNKKVNAYIDKETGMVTTDNMPFDLHGVDASIATLISYNSEFDFLNNCT